MVAACGCVFFETRIHDKALEKSPLKYNKSKIFYRVLGYFFIRFVSEICRSFANPKDWVTFGVLMLCCKLAGQAGIREQMFWEGQSQGKYVRKNTQKNCFHALFLLK